MSTRTIFYSSAAAILVASLLTVAAVLNTQQNTNNDMNMIEKAEKTKEETIIPSITAADISSVDYDNYNPPKIVVVPSAPKVFTLPPPGSDRNDVIAWTENQVAEYKPYINWVQITNCGSGARETIIASGCYTENNDFIEVSIQDKTPNSYILDVVSHELAHAVIFKRCGTVMPFERYENITEAYSDKYLFGFSNIRGYEYNKDDENKADLIWLGKC